MTGILGEKKKRGERKKMTKTHSSSGNNENQLATKKKGRGKR